MNARLSREERERVKGWLDSYPPGTEPSYTLRLPQPDSVTFDGPSPARPINFREVDIARELCRYGRDWWQWVACNVFDGEPLVFGQLRRGIPRPIHPVAKEVAYRLQGQILDRNSADYIRDQVKLRERT